jgi:hypothetical protein
MKHEEHLRLSRGRLERAFINFPRFVALEAASRAGGSHDPEGPRIFLSRLIIALNSMAQDLSGADDDSLRAVADEAADMLWSIGESCGVEDKRLRMADAERPPPGVNEFS